MALERQNAEVHKRLSDAQAAVEASQQARQALEAKQDVMADQVHQVGGVPSLALGLGLGRDGGNSGGEGGRSWAAEDATSTASSQKNNRLHLSATRVFVTCSKPA